MIELCVFDLQQTCAQSANALHTVSSYAHPIALPPARRHKQFCHAIATQIFIFCMADFPMRDFLRYIKDRTKMLIYLIENKVLTSQEHTHHA
jgi:hypothetical protein